MHIETHAPSVPPSDTISPPGLTEDSTLLPLTALTALDDAIENLGVPVPCRAYDPEVFFAESPADVEYATSRTARRTAAPAARRPAPPPSTRSTARTAPR
ncbi:hypothetical protein ABT334_33905, partial [Streptomyces albidoflavus]